MIKIKVMAFTLIVLLFCSCTNELNLKEVGFEKSFESAKKKFNAEKYVESLNDFEVILLNYSGHAGIDSAQFFLAQSHYELEEYISASYEFEKLVDNFPQSKLSEEALFKAALSYSQLSPSRVLDQSESKKALTKFQIFLDKYKSGDYADKAREHNLKIREKLARKEYEAGLLYLKMEQPRAAKVYFKSIMEKFYDSSFYLESVSNYAESCRQMDDDYNYQLYMKKYNKLKEKLGSKE